MKTLLHLNSSPRGNYSVSRKLSSEVVAAWKAKNPEGKVIERDLAQSHLTFVDLDWIMGAFTPPENHSEAHKKAIAVSDELVAELLASDVIVIGTPMYNFAVPAALKAWIDHIDLRSLLPEGFWNAYFLRRAISARKRAAAEDVPRLRTQAGGASANDEWFISVVPTKRRKRLLRSTG